MAVRSLAAIALTVVQLIDIAVHLGTDQIEPVRLASNALIVGWLVWTLIVRAPSLAGWIVILGYVALNTLFLAVNGLTNPQMDDALRIPLFGFVGVSVLLALTLHLNSKSAPSQRV